MAGTKLSDLSAATTLTGSELIYTVQSGQSVRTTAAQLLVSLRHILTADTTYYVATTGNDTTGVGSVGNPWATLQKAYNYVTSAIDFAGFDVIIQLADGTYAQSGRSLSADDAWVGGGNLTIQGNLADRTAVKLQRTGTNSNLVISCSIPTSLTIKFLQAIHNDAAFTANISHSGVGRLNLDSVDMGGGAIGFGTFNEGASINVTGDITILSAGTGTGHMQNADGGMIFYFPNSVTATGTVSYTAFALNDGPTGAIQAGLFTISGTFTGMRYAIYGGVILGYSTALDDLPGDAAGVVYDGAHFTDHNHGWATQTNDNQITDKGTVSSGTVTFDRADGQYQKLTVGGALTAAFTHWPPAGIAGQFILELVNGSTNVTWPTIHWFKGDGTSDTTLANIGVTLQTSGTNFIHVWSTNAGSTLYGKVE